MMQKQVIGLAKKNKSVVVNKTGKAEGHITDSLGTAAIKWLPIINFRFSYRAYKGKV